MQLSDRRDATKQLLSCISVFDQMIVLIIRELQKPFSDRFPATSSFNGKGPIIRLVR